MTQPVEFFNGLLDALVARLHVKTRIGERLCMLHNHFFGAEKSALTRLCTSVYIRKAVMQDTQVMQHYAGAPRILAADDAG